MQFVYKNFTRNRRYIMLYEEILFKVHYMDATIFQTYEINMHYLGGIEYAFASTVTLQFIYTDAQKM